MNSSDPGAPPCASSPGSVRIAGDRISTLLESLTPTTLPRDTFRRFRNEEGADFQEAMEKNPALRRFQVREVGDDELPETSSGIEERVRVRYMLVVAYPQTHRYGPANAMDRDDVINQDWKKINGAIGMLIPPSLPLIVYGVIAGNSVNTGKPPIDASSPHTRIDAPLDVSEE